MSYNLADESSRFRVKSLHQIWASTGGRHLGFWKLVLHWPQRTALQVPVPFGMHFSLGRPHAMNIYLCIYAYKNRKIRIKSCFFVCENIKGDLKTGCLLSDTRIFWRKGWLWTWETYRASAFSRSTLQLTFVLLFTISSTFRSKNSYIYPRKTSIDARELLR